MTSMPDVPLDRLRARNYLAIPDYRSIDGTPAKIQGTKKIRVVSIYVLTLKALHSFQ